MRFMSVRGEAAARVRGLQLRRLLLRLFGVQIAARGCFAHRDRRLHRLHVGLLYKDLLHLHAWGRGGEGRRRWEAAPSAAGSEQQQAAPGMRARAAAAPRATRRCARAGGPTQPRPPRRSTGPAHVFTERLELVLCQVLAALDLLYPFVQIHHAAAAACEGLAPGPGAASGCAGRLAAVWGTFGGPTEPWAGWRGRGRLCLSRGGVRDR